MVASNESESSCQINLYIINQAGFALTQNLQMGSFYSGRCPEPRKPSHNWKTVSCSISSTHPGDIEKCSWWCRGHCSLRLLFRIGYVLILSTFGMNVLGWETCSCSKQGLLIRTAKSFGFLEWFHGCTFTRQARRRNCSIFCSWPAQDHRLNGICMLQSRCCTPDVVSTCIT